jgi:hypothetical protein
MTDAFGGDAGPCRVPRFRASRAPGRRNFPGIDPTTPVTIEGATMSLAIGAPGIAQTIFHDDGGAASQLRNAGQDAVIDKPRPHDEAPAGSQVGNAGQDVVIDKPRPYDDAPAGSHISPR